MDTRENLDELKIIHCPLGFCVVKIILDNDTFYDLNKLNWNGDEEYKYLTLSEIKNQINKKLMIVWQDSPTHGELYQYGNYGDYWVQIGTTCGFA